MASNEQSHERAGFSYGLLVSVGIGLIVGFLLENLLIGVLLSTALAFGFEVARNYL
jgi:hypothetical protein